MKRQISFAAVAITALIAATPVAAADFTLDVPVRLQNLPALTSVGVDCLISRVAPGGPYAAGGTNVIGRGSAPVPISGGSFDGTVTVEIDNSSIIPSSEARSYICSMRGSGRATTGTTYTASSGNFQDVYQTATGQTLDRVMVHAEGSIP